MRTYTKTSIITLSQNQLTDIQDSIQSIRAYTAQGSYQLIVVDLESTDGSREWLAEQTDVLSIYASQPFDYSLIYNQALEIATAPFILFMNQPGIVTPNWLALLQETIDKSEDIGAVGPIANFSKLGREAGTEFRSMEDLVDFSLKRQEELSEITETLRLDDFCLLVDREVLSSIGLFDKRFNSPSLLIADMCLKMIDKKKRLFVCNHVYIHLYGWTDVSEQEEAFTDKWGFSLKETEIDRSMEWFTEKNLDEIDILHVGCGCGGTILELQQKYPNARISAIESNSRSSVIAARFSNVIHGDPLVELERFGPERFDKIIINTELHGLERILTMCRPILKHNGTLVANFSNSQYFKSIKQLLGFSNLTNCLYAKKITEITSLFERSGYAQLDIKQIEVDPNESEHKYINDLERLSDESTREVLKVSNYLISVQRTTDDEQINHLIEKIISNDSMQQGIKELLKYPASSVAESLITKLDRPIPALNLMAINSMENHLLDAAIHFLSNAFELDRSNDLTIMNLATVFYHAGKAEEALHWLERLDKQDEVVVKWITKMKSELHNQRLDEAKMKYLLRRIEFDIDRQASLNDLVELIRIEEVTVEEMIENIQQHNFSRSQVLNYIALACYEHELIDPVVPLLKLANDLDPDNEDILFNLGYVLYQLQEYALAEHYLTKLQNADESTLLILREIGELHVHG